MNKNKKNAYKFYKSYKYMELLNNGYINVLKDLVLFGH